MGKVSGSWITEHLFNTSCLVLQLSSDRVLPAYVSRLQTAKRYSRLHRACCGWFSFLLLRFQIPSTDHCHLLQCHTGSPRGTLPSPQFQCHPVTVIYGAGATSLCVSADAVSRHQAAFVLRLPIFSLPFTRLQNHLPLHLY